MTNRFCFKFFFIMYRYWNGDLPFPYLIWYIDGCHSNFINLFILFQICMMSIFNELLEHNMEVFYGWFNFIVHDSSFDECLSSSNRTCFENIFGEEFGPKLWKLSFYGGKCLLFWVTLSLKRGLRLTKLNLKLCDQYPILQFSN